MKSPSVHAVIVDPTVNPFMVGGESPAKNLTGTPPPPRPPPPRPASPPKTALDDLNDTIRMAMGGPSPSRPPVPESAPVPIPQPNPAAFQIPQAQIPLQMNYSSSPAKVPMAAMQGKPAPLFSNITSFLESGDERNVEIL